MPLNVEFKARCSNLAAAEQLLLNRQPRFVGEDWQRDTYFNVNEGRLKLREGRIENALIHYRRADAAGIKRSDVLLYQHQPEPALKAILTEALGVKVVVEKTRRIYFVDHIKFHFDTVPGLGHFLEVEAIDTDGRHTADELLDQCQHYASLFGITPTDYVTHSYSDLLLEKKSSLPADPTPL